MNSLEPRVIVVAARITVCHFLELRVFYDASDLEMKVWRDRICVGSFHHTPLARPGLRTGIEFRRTIWQV